MSAVLGGFAAGMLDADRGAAVLGAWLDHTAAVDDRRRIDLTPGTWQGKDAKAAQDVWNNFVAVAPIGERPENAKLGLAVGVELPPDLELARALAHAPGLAALHFIDAPPRAPADWQWPVDLALLPDPASQRVRTWKLRWDHFVTRIDALHATAPIELLLCTGSMANALAGVRGALPRVQAVLVLGERGFDIEAARALREQMRADAVCIASIPTAKQRQLVDDVLYQLSHDVDLDVAFTLACRKAKAQAPLLIAARGAFARAHAAQWASAVASGLSGRDDFNVTANGGGPKPAAEVGAELEDKAEKLGWEHEHHSAEFVARAGRGARSAPPGRPRRARYVNAKLCNERDEKLDLAPLVPGPHYLDVWIGEPEAGALVAARALRFTPSTTGHELTLVMTSPALAAPIVRKTLVPPDGKSTTVRFDFIVPADTVRFEARIAVLQGNRILQTVKLVAAVGAGPPEPLELGLECVTRVDLDGAAAGRPFDAALLFNQLGGEDSMSLFQNEKASLVALDDIQTLLDNIAVVLEAATDDPASHRKLDSEKSVALLAGLARQGSLLKERLFQSNLVQDDPLAKAKRIQVISAKPERLIPIEFCYDPPAPDLGAKLCKQWKHALTKGTCDAKCPGNKRKVICPVGFWGTSKTIERRMYRKKTAIAPHDFALLPDPTSTRAALDVLGGSLCGAAKQARETDKQGKDVDRAFATIKKLTKRGAEVTSWSAWKKTAKQSQASLFVLLAHTDVEPDMTQTLWIGKTPTALSSIDTTYRGKPGNGTLALLLGCSTATHDAFASFSSQFQLKGQVSIVVGTLAKILGRHAAPIAEQVVKALAAIKKTPDGTPFGEVMMQLRRKLLLSGYPIVMSLVAFGDAEWKL